MPNIPRRLLAGLALLPLFTALHAQPFPGKPVRLITPAPAGGITDITLRKLAVELQRIWGQPVVIDNRPGGTGMVALQALMASPNDGHVLGMQVSGFMIVQPIAHGDRFEPLKAATPIAFLSEYPLVLATGARSPFGNWKQFVDWRNALAQTASYGTSGIGGTPHLTGELIKRATGQQLQDVPYKGDSPMIADVVGGQIPLGLPIIGSAFPMLKSGQLKAVAVTSAARVPFAPDIPTLKEQGVDVVSAPWNYLQGPASMDPALVARIARDVRTAMNTSEMKEFYENSALVWHDMDREQLVAKIKADAQVGTRLIRELKIPVN